MENLIGDKFVNNKLEDVNPEEVFNCKIICLFFTASWCSPCEIFSKQLLEVYEEANQGEKFFEIIAVSFEKNEQNFKSFVSDKPWVFIPYGNSKIEELKEKYNILNIPVFYAMDNKGNIITDDARKQISEFGINIVEKWIKDNNIK